MLPCVLFEDEHLLAVNKPAGWNTHAPSPYAGEGIYDWLKHREPRWATLAILHRLDKETSGIMIFGKTPVANRSLTKQFAGRRVRKQYWLLTQRAVPRQAFTAKSLLVRVGDKYASRPGGEPAETRFDPVTDAKGLVKNAGLRLVRAEPLTGRTHQIRVHAAENGFPILGDTLYGGSASSRVFLHAGEIGFAHPVTGAPMWLGAPLDFEADPRLALRAAMIEPEFTNAYRLVHGASDGWPGWLVDRVGEYLLSQAEGPLNGRQLEELKRLAGTFAVRGAYHKVLSRQVRRTTLTESSPQLVWGEAAPVAFEVLENGVRFELSFCEGYSAGLFLDQRDNRRRLLTGYVAAQFRLPEAVGGVRPELLNVFAYTCGFSVCAARAGARATSLDLSRKYLDWGWRNFDLNGLNPAEHEFIRGDAFDWLRRLEKKGRRFDIVVLDPPTFSQSRESGVFRVERNLGDLVAAGLRVLKPGGVLLGCANAAGWPAEDFAATLQGVIAAEQTVLAGHYVPQPPDFPVSRAEPAYLKTMWWKLKA
jgi:23S rRNA (cytosine1962-C5)-methyltransferase